MRCFFFFFPVGADVAGCDWVQELQDQVAGAAERESREELMRVRKEIVDFHGEMVLLENYSALNYTGILQFFFNSTKKLLLINLK